VTRVIRKVSSPTSESEELVRCGKDELPGPNASIDAFVTAVLARNSPVSVANTPDTPHEFDLMVDCDASGATIRQLLAWLRFQLRD